MDKQPNSFEDTFSSSLLDYSSSFTRGGEMINMQAKVTSARQVSEVFESLNHMQKVATEDRTMRRKGVDAQVESAKILADQHDEIAVMKEAMNALLRHSLEQSEQQAIAMQVRDRVEAERYRQNTQLSKIAAWAGVISMILAAVGIAIQLL